MEGYERKGNTVTVWKTNGKEDPPTPTNIDIEDLENDLDYGDGKAIWVPHDRR